MTSATSADSFMGAAVDHAASACAEPMTPREEDRILVERAQAGDASAFDTLVVKYSPKLYGLIYNMTANRDDASDVLQEVFTKAYRAIKRFRGQSSFYTWIYSIATNLTINFLNKRKRRFTYSLDDIDSGIERDQDFIDATAGSDPRREAGLRELQQKLNEAMMALSEPHRVVVTLYDIQGLAHAEIAKIVGVSEGTVRSRLFYAHRQLQSLLADYLK